MTDLRKRVHGIVLETLKGEAPDLLAFPVETIHPFGRCIVELEPPKGHPVVTVVLRYPERSRRKAHHAARTFGINSLVRAELEYREPQMKPIPRPHVEGKTEYERSANSMRKVLSAPLSAKHERKAPKQRTPKEMTYRLINSANKPQRCETWQR
jgi:hypothetical protein